MKLYNTLNRKIEEFKPQNPSEVTIYTCGPTVYSSPHIGNFTAYIYWDLLIRTLIANGYKVKRVLNMTDVGHLTSDADDGEDKLEKGAKKEGKTVWEIADYYINEFMRDFRALNLLEPAKIARATDYIEEDKSIVDKLIAAGVTYETTDGIYYDTSKNSTYADFARLDLEHLKAGARVDFNSEKKNPSDFAVWKFIKPGEKHAMRWDYLGRPGYPGWHLECSTIIHKELGEPIDIHTGGIDHIPVHHTNEIAQTLSAFSKPLANYWLHCNFITINGEKISKSLGNTYTLAEIGARNFSPMDYKLWVLQGHFQSERNFSFEDLTAAKNRRLSWRNRIALTYQKHANLRDYRGILDEIKLALSDNLNSPKALSIIDQVDFAPIEFWKQVDEMLGLGLVSSAEDFSGKIKHILDERAAARAEKDWAKSDALRTKLEEKGITVKDTPDGQIWQYLA